MPSSACDWSSDVCSSDRSEEHTSELQSRSDLVCRLLLEKKKAHDLTPVTVRPGMPSLSGTTTVDIHRSGEGRLCSCLRNRRASSPMQETQCAARAPPASR